jgi:hypothetical protein
MTGSRSKLRWSDDQIRKALARRALAVYTNEELEILRDLAVVGWNQISARRAGGRIKRQPAARAEIRRILVSAIFDGSFSPGLPPRLRKTPTAPPTLKKVCQILRQCGFIVSEATVLKDVKKIGTRKLRGR